MRTKQYISTITYNTIPYLELKLNEMVGSNILDFYAFIYHKKECDEKKDHIHLFLMPSRQVDTAKLNEDLSQPVKDSDKPLGTCGIWHIVGKNNISDWILYSLHDAVYCKLKGYLDRVYTYSIEDMHTSNVDGLNELYFDALHSSKFYFDKHIRDVILQSENHYQAGVELVKNGYVPLQNACSFHHFLQMI